MPYLLDTNIVSDLVRNPRGRVTQKIREIGTNQVSTSIIVAAELRFGAAKSGSARLSAQVAAILGAMEVLPFEIPADQIYAELRNRLEVRGQPIGANDLLIAAHAMANDFVLVTANEREFGRIEELTCENWLHPGQ
jgi:tRNA(fMet)-specific endonuclease VapC